MQAVLHSFAYGLAFLREQVADVAAKDMVAQPPGFVAHPAWTIGHLTYISQSVGEVIGVPAWLGEDWAKRFGSGSVPVPDVDMYEAKDVALAMLEDARLRVAATVERMPESHLRQPFPDPSYSDVFPSIRHFLTQVLAGHTAYHIGQVGAWRRAMSMPPLGRSFE